VKNVTIKIVTPIIGMYGKDASIELNLLGGVYMAGFPIILPTPSPSKHSSGMKINELLLFEPSAKISYSIPETAWLLNALTCNVPEIIEPIFGANDCIDTATPIELCRKPLPASICFITLNFGIVKFLNLATKISNIYQNICILSIIYISVGVFQ